LAPLLASPAIAASALHRALAQLQQKQPLHASTGGMHAAAWANAAGDLLAVREDVGRHNALDKLIGALAKDRRDHDAAGFALVTSRASFEMVQKAASVGIPILAAVSAPTGYAIRLAQDVGLTLAGFVRQGRYTVYSTPERIETRAAHEY
jgi:formate dehydrogenase accessory protein FdhD